MEAIEEFLTGRSLAVYFFIFFGKLIEVALTSLRAQLFAKKEKIAGAIVAAFEYTIWLALTASAITAFHGDYMKLVVLVSAFVLGNVMGSIFEEKMALGYCTLNCLFIKKEDALHAAEMLREKGHAVTMFKAEGMNGEERTIAIVHIRRRNTQEVKDILLKADPRALISFSPNQRFSGGTIAK